MLTTEDLRLQGDVLIVTHAKVDPTKAVLTPFLAAPGFLASVATLIASCHFSLVL